MLNSLRHPRKRAISIGPQSEADAYEAMAYREQKRRESLSSSGLPRSAKSPNNRLTDGKRSHISWSSAGGSRPKATTTRSRPQAPWSEDASLAIKLNRERPPDDQAIVNSDFIQVHDMNGPTEFGTGAEATEDEKNDREMFRKLQKPRVRYDVEVVTKVIVYAGK